MSMTDPYVPPLSTGFEPHKEPDVGISKDEIVCAVSWNRYSILPRTLVLQTLVSGSQPGPGPD